MPIATPDYARFNCRGLGFVRGSGLALVPNCAQTFGWNDRNQCDSNPKLESSDKALALLPRRGAGPCLGCAILFRLICSAAIFDVRVVGRMPSNSAAPLEP